jgi:hypothetical protein
MREPDLMYHMEAVSAGDLMRFLDIDKQRLRVWIAAGLFGEHQKRVGSGRTRLYAFPDVVMAHIARDVMDLTRSRSVASGGAVVAAMLGAVLKYFRDPKLYDQGRFHERQTWLVVARVDGAGKPAAFLVDGDEMGRVTSYPAMVVVNLTFVVKRVRGLFGAD